LVIFQIEPVFVENKGSLEVLSEVGNPLANMQSVAHTLRYLTDGERRLDMAATTLFTCVCGLQKKTSNHWVLAKTTKHGITFMPWDWDLAMNSDIVVLCGEGCAAAMLSRSLGDWKKPVQNVTVTEPELAVA
jgi:hypothetical protein